MHSIGLLNETHGALAYHPYGHLKELPKSGIARLKYGLRALFRYIKYGNIGCLHAEVEHPEFNDNHRQLKIRVWRRWWCIHRYA